MTQNRTVRHWIRSHILTRFMLRKLFLCFLCTMFFHLTAYSADMTIHVIRLAAKDGKTISYGDSVLLESNNKYLLMDTGHARSADAVVQYLKRHKVKNLDIYISHMHSDHIGGLSKILSTSSLHVGRIYLPNKKYGGKLPEAEAGYNKIKKLIKGKHIKCSYLSVDSSFSIGDARLKVFGPIGKYSTSSINYMNDHSLCCVIRCGNIKYITTGDISFTEEHNLLSKYGNHLKADIMKISHHGCNGSTSIEWLNAVRPKYAFASGANIYPDVKSNVTKYAKLLVTGVNNKNFQYVIHNDHIKVKQGS